MDSVNGTFPISDATNKHTPTGGVVSPITKFKTAINPKFIGSTPTSVTTFNKTGTKIKRADIVSKKHPANINIKLINNNINILFVVIDNNVDANN